MAATIEDLLSRLTPERIEALRGLLTKVHEHQKRGATVFTDGSCLNQGKSSAKAGFGVFWGDDHPNNESGKVDGLQDNNRAELYAACHAIRQALHQGYHKIRIHSDSEFVRRVIERPQEFDNMVLQTYIHYHDLIQSINQMRHSIEVSVDYVPAHSGHYGNVKADGLAKIGVRTVSLEFIARYTIKVRKMAEGRAKKSKPNESKVVIMEGSELLRVPLASKIAHRRKRGLKSPKKVEAKTAAQPKTPPAPTTSMKVEPKKPVSVASKKTAPPKTPKTRPTNLNSLVRSMSKVSLSTTLTATQKRKNRRQRAKFFAQLDGVKDLRGVMKSQKEKEVKKAAGKSKSAQNGQDGQNPKKKKIVKK